MEAISFHDFNFAYPDGEGTALSHITMHVEEGAFCLLVGPSGSGKTTLCRCMCPALFPNGRVQGTVKLFGRDLLSCTNQGIVGFVQQDPDAQIVCDKVWKEMAFGLENLGMAQNRMHRRIAEVATYFGIGSYFNYDCSDLSGGQKQLLNIASVIAMNPKILVLDEPTAQLDPISTEGLIDALARINRMFGTTVIVATQSPESFLHVANNIYSVMSGAVCKSEDAPMKAPDAITPYYESENRLCGPADMPTVVAVKDATFAYSKNEPNVLDKVKLHISKGEIVSLVGANGCGKTTLLKMLAGILKLQSGKIENDLHASQAYLPQDIKILFSQDSAFEELMEWSRSAGYSSNDVKEMAEKLGLVDALKQNPLDLSCGQQQKFGIAKMLLCKPELLLFDEPTKGLDGQSQYEIANALVKLANEGATIVIATHDLAFASRISSKMALVFDGEIACMQDSKSFCDENLFYIPQPNQFSALWDESHAFSAQKGVL